MTLGSQLLSCVMCEILFDLLYTFLQNIADRFELHFCRKSSIYIFCLEYALHTVMICLISYGGIPAPIAPYAASVEEDVTIG